MIPIPILFPEELYKALKSYSRLEKEPIAKLVRRAVEKELKSHPYRSPLLEMAKNATGSEKCPKKDYSLKVDKTLYGEE